MEKSIENMWKEGFKNSALVAPKVDDMYTKKSNHIIDKFTRMFKINLIAILVFAVGFTIYTFIVGIPITGILFFITLMTLVAVNKKLLNGLQKISKGDSSYEYLKNFNTWIDKQVTINERLSRFMYPSIFLAIILGLWFKDAEGSFLGQRLVDKIVEGFPNTTLLFGVPLIGIVAVLIVIIALALLGARIYRWDLNMIYGGVFKKLKMLLKDFEELRK